MSKDRGPWQEGRRALRRVSAWHQEAGAGEGGDGPPDAGAAAVAALADIGLLRRLLDQAELVAVRAARRHGRSWAEIATQLGVARQSAWERWRELDGPGGATRREPALPVEDAAAAEVVDRAARELRRRSDTVVPAVVGMRWDQARDALLAAGLVAVGPDPDGPPLAASGWPGGVVSDQSPEAGARVPAGSRVTLWVDGGGGSGVREPRRPRPAPRRGRAMRDEVDEEVRGGAVG